MPHKITFWLFRFSLVASLISQTSRAADPAVFPRAAAQPSLNEVLEDVEDALRPTRTLTLDVKEGPWAIVHGILALDDTLLVTGGALKEEKISALSWLSKGATAGQIPAFLWHPTGIRGQMYDAKTHEWVEILEGHPQQFFGYVSDLGLPVSTPWKAWNTQDKKWVDGTIADMIRDARAETGINRHPNKVYDMSWLLWGLARYTPSTDRWKNSKGELWSHERILAYELKEGIKPTTACLGFHKLYAMDIAVKRYRNENPQLSLTYTQAAQFVARQVQYLRSTQNLDGSFAKSGPLGAGMAPDWNWRTTASGHALEFLMQALPDDRLLEPWVLRGAQSLALDIRLGEGEVGWGPLFHATHALKLFQERTAKLEAARSVQ